VQLSEATKAAHELSPEARALLSSAVRRDEMLMMLQEKADITRLNIVSEQALSLLASNDELRAQITALFGQQTQVMAGLALEREQGDAALGSRLDNIEIMFASSRGGVRQAQKPPTIKLPISTKLAPSPSQAIPLPIAPAPSTNLGSDVHELKDETPSSLVVDAEEPPPLKAVDALYPQHNLDSGCVVKSLSAPNVEDTEIAPMSFSQVIPQEADNSTVGALSGRVDATVGTSVEPTVPLVSYLQPPADSSSVIPPVKSGTSPQDDMNTSSSILTRVENKQQAPAAMRCLSCDAPSVKPESSAPPHGRTLGGGFKLGALLQGD